MKDPKNGVAPCEDFFLHVVEAHILSACMTVFDMSSTEDKPSSSFFPMGSSDLNPEERSKILMLAVREVVDKYVDLSMEPVVDEEECETAVEAPSGDFDHVLEYASDVLTMGVLYMEFVDAIREADGDRILRCWRYFLLVFKATGRTNYSAEAFKLLAQYDFLFSERMRMQLIWSRTVNVHGRPGKNVSCDLHNEHLNRECKQSISGLGSNITDGAIQRVGRSLGATTAILERFDCDNGVPLESGHHTVRSSAADMAKLLKQLTDSKAFMHNPGRCHSNFPKFEANVVKHLSRPNLKQWLQEQLQRLLTYQYRNF